MSYTKTTNHTATTSNNASQVRTVTPHAVPHDGSILERIAQATYKRIEEERKLVPDETLIKQAQARATKEKEEAGFTFPFEQALAAPGISFICEVKKASPSKGIIAEDFPYVDIAKEYEKAGASAISCLTEPYWFLGSNDYLQAITNEVSIPVLRKDFTIDARMIYEAKVLGAQAILLICSLLNDKKLHEYISLAHSLGLSALIETHDETEIARALKEGARIIGVNNRNLATFDVDTQNSKRLRNFAGNDVLFVSESGISTHDDIASLATIGVDAVLIGEALMRSTDKKAMLAYLKTGESNGNA